VRCTIDAADLRDCVCTGCLTLQEDVADTAAFAAACDRVARSAASPEVARHARRWMELALENLVRRQSVGYDSRPLSTGASTDRPL
jgi:hypothetical protein